MNNEVFYYTKQNKNILCQCCGTTVSSHSVGAIRLCCSCYIKAGNPPSDWHSQCMIAAKQLNDNLQTFILLNLKL